MATLFKHGQPSKVCKWVIAVLKMKLQTVGKKNPKRSPSHTFFPSFNVQAMLYGRTCKLVEFENATKSLEKAKPLKKEAAEELKDKKEREFNEISEVAKKEISKFQRQRVVEFQKALILYAEAKIKTARDISALIAKDISTLKQMEFSDSASE